MYNGVNLWLWLAILPSYFFYEYVGTKNIIATSKLKPIEASNTGAIMYIIGVLGTYICVTDGLVNIVPIIIGSWLGTYYSVVAEIKIKRKKHVGTSDVKRLNCLSYFGRIFLGNRPKV